jgi:hypothetical protein
MLAVTVLLSRSLEHSDRGRLPYWHGQIAVPLEISMILTE